MNKILLIPVSVFRERAIPLGIGYIASLLEKNNYKVKVYDPAPYEKIDIVDYIKKFSPDIIGISTMTTSFTAASQIATKIKSNFDIPIVFGGVHPTVTPVETLKNTFIDYVVIGEGEYTFLELLDSLSNGKNLKHIRGLGYKDDKIIINTPRPLIKNLDILPLPARHLFPKWYFGRRLSGTFWMKTADIMTSRGCPYNCVFCSSRALFGRRVRFHSVNYVVDEIEHILNKYKSEMILFADDTFSINEKRAIKICREIRRRKLDFTFYAQLRADTTTDKLVKELVKAGCKRVTIGAESGSQRILNILKKGITPKQTLNSCKIVKKYGLFLYLSFMIGNPTETYEDIEMTRKLAKKSEADELRFFITTPYPGTELYNSLINENPEMKKISYDKFHPGGDNSYPIFKTSIPKDEIVDIQKKLNDEFMKSYVLKIIKNKWFIIDTISLILQKPFILTESAKKLVKTRKFTEFYRVFYDGHKMRR